MYYTEANPGPSTWWGLSILLKDQMKVTRLRNAFYIADIPKFVISATFECKYNLQVISLKIFMYK